MLMLHGRAGAERGWLGAAARWARRLGRDRRGAVAMIIALSVPVLFGALGLGIDAGVWYHAKRDLQSAADAAAIAATHEVARNHGNTEITAAAQTAVDKNGYPASVIISVEAPPTSGEFAGEDAAAVQLASPAQLLFLGALSMEEFDIAANATAITDIGNADFCVMALNGTAPKALDISGSVTVDLDCAMASNSNASDSVYFNGDADITTDYISSAGGIQEGGSVTMVSRAPSLEGVLPHYDPYEDLAEPSTIAPCDQTTEVKVQNGDNVVLSPGVYCKGITVTGGNLTFSPGTYVMRGGDFTVNGGTVSSSGGVTFFATESASGPSKWANFNFTGNPDIDLSAPTSGTYEDILFYQDPDAPPVSGANGQNDLTGGSNMRLDGVIYLPTRTLHYSGGAGSAGCTVLIGSKVVFSGTSDIRVDCSSRPDMEFPASRFVRLAA